MKKTKPQRRLARHQRVRAKIKGTPERPRVSIFKSNRYISAQIIDDQSGKTLLSNSLKEKIKAKSKTEKATKIGEMLAEKIKAAGINEIVFDRGGFKYHGRVKALADGLRKGGIKF